MDLKRLQKDLEEIKGYITDDPEKAEDLLDFVIEEIDIAAQHRVQSDVCPVCAGKRNIQTKSRGLVKCASCNGTGQRR